MPSGQLAALGLFSYQTMARDGLSVPGFSLPKALDSWFRLNIALDASFDLATLNPKP